MPHATMSDGVKLFYEETGTGFPVLCIHEFAGDHSSWEPQVRAFSRQYRCITYNARGYPPSDVPGDVGKYSQDRAVADAHDMLKALGIERLIITNASGGINPHLRGGDIVVVRDHINLLPEHPLRGPNDERLGPRFPDMSKTYDADLRSKALAAAKKHGVRAFEGVYSAMQGPNLETPAEYVMLRQLGRPGGYAPPRS